MRILGIDPSIKSTGYGIIELSNNNYSVLIHGVIKPSRKLVFHQKLNEIKSQIDKIIDTYSPDEVAIENPFFAHNVKTALTLGQVRGAVLVAIASHDCSLHEYSVLEIKKAATGYGRADKNQVKTMIKVLLNLENERIETDASDALAAALCHLNTRIFQEKVEGS